MIHAITAINPSHTTTGRPMRGGDDARPLRSIKRVCWYLLYIGYICCPEVHHRVRLVCTRSTFVRPRSTPSWLSSVREWPQLRATNSVDFDYMDAIVHFSIIAAKVCVWIYSSHILYTLLQKEILYVQTLRRCAVHSNRGNLRSLKRRDHTARIAQRYRAHGHTLYSSPTSWPRERFYLRWLRGNQEKVARGFSYTRFEDDRKIRA